MYVGFISLKYI